MFRGLRLQHHSPLPPPPAPKAVSAADPLSSTPTPPAQRLIVVLAAVHAARNQAIRDLTLDDIDIPNRRITIAGHRRRLDDLTGSILQAWLDHRRATWPHTPNRHVLIAEHLLDTRPEQPGPPSPADPGAANPPRFGPRRLPNSRGFRLKYLQSG